MHIHPTYQKFVRKNYDMVLGLPTSQKFQPQINTSYSLETLWKCIKVLQVVWSSLYNWRGSVATGKYTSGGNLWNYVA